MLTYRKERIDNALLFFAEKHYKKTKKYLSQTFLYKYLAFFEFRYLKAAGDMPLELTYKVMERGPVPMEIYDNRKNPGYFLKVIFEPFQTKGGKEGYLVKPNGKFNSDYFAEAELEEMNNLIEMFARQWVGATEMKKHINALFLLISLVSVILLLASCTSKITIVANTTGELVEEKTAPLIIGGKQYRGYLGGRVEIIYDGLPALGFAGDPVYCTTEDIDKLIVADLRVDPENPEYMSSIENLELLTNLKELYIRNSNLDGVDLNPLAFLANLEMLFILETNFGSVDLRPLVFLTNLKRLNILGTNLASVNFSPLVSLINLEDIFIDGDISKLPDLTVLNKLKSINIKNSALETLDGLGAPRLEHLEIDGMEKFETLAPLSNLTELELLYIVTRRAGSLAMIGDLNNVPYLKSLTLMTDGPLDVTGIERLIGLNHVDLIITNLVNPQGISKLHNLVSFSMDIEEKKPSVEYLRGLQKLENLILESGSFWKNIGEEPHQVLDVSPLADNHNLQILRMRHFIIKNISSLDNLKNLEHPEGDTGIGGIDLVGSRLFDENEKSVHDLLFNRWH